MVHFPFSKDFPLRFSLHFLDLILYFGDDILPVISVAIFIQYKEEIMNISKRYKKDDQAGVIEVSKFLSNLHSNLNSKDFNKLIALILKIWGSSSVQSTITDIKNRDKNNDSYDMIDYQFAVKNYS